MDLDTKAVNDFIKYWQGRVTLKEVWLGCVLCVLFSFLLESEMTVIFIIISTCLSLYASIDQRKEMVLLCMSNLFTIIAIEFIFLSVQFLRGVADVPTIYLIVLIAIYFMIFICNILFMIRQIKRGKFANKKKRMGASLGFSIIGYVIGMVLIRIIEMNFSYNTTIFIGSGVVLLGAYLFAFGSHFYLCFYLLKKKNHTEKTME